MCKVNCDSITCKNNKNGICNAEIISIKNFEYWVDEKKEYDDKEICGSYEKDSMWLCK